LSIQIVKSERGIAKKKPKNKKREVFNYFPLSLILEANNVLLQDTTSNN